MSGLRSRARWKNAKAGCAPRSSNGIASCAELAAEALERTIVLNGDGLDAALLREAGIERADAMLAVTDDDRANMLVAVRAKAEGCALAIALINDPSNGGADGPAGDRCLY